MKYVYPFLMLVAIWGGTYTMHLTGSEHWATFPILATAGALWFVGVVGTINKWVNV